MGVYRVPMDVGTKTSIDAALKHEEEFEEIDLVCFKDEEYKSYTKYLEEKRNGSN